MSAFRTSLFGLRRPPNGENRLLIVVHTVHQAHEAADCFPLLLRATTPRQKGDGASGIFREARDGLGEAVQSAPFEDVSPHVVLNDQDLFRQGYELGTPDVLVHVKGQTPPAVSVYQLQKFRLLRRCPGHCLRSRTIEI